MEGELLGCSDFVLGLVGWSGGREIKIQRRREEREFGYHFGIRKRDECKLNRFENTFFYTAFPHRSTPSH